MIKFNPILDETHYQIGIVLTQIWFHDFDLWEQVILIVLKKSNLSLYCDLDNVIWVLFFSITASFLEFHLNVGHIVNLFDIVSNQFELRAKHQTYLVVFKAS